MTGVDVNSENVIKTLDNDAKTEEMTRIPVRDSPDNAITSEPNNNDAKAPRSKKDLHLPLSNGNVSAEVDRDIVQAEKLKKKKVKESGVKKSDEKKRSSEKVKVPKKSSSDDKEKGDKSVKKSDKEKVVKKEESKEKVRKKESSGTKKTDHNESSGIKNSDHKDESKKTDKKEESKSKSKSKDGTKSPQTEKKSSKKSDLKDKKTDSPKRKSESKEKKNKGDCINNPDPPILGSARPLVFTNLASKLVSCTSSQESNEPAGDNSHDSMDNYRKEGQCYTLCKEPNGDTVRNHDNQGLALVPTPAGDVPFGRYFEEFIFVVCLFTFLSLCIGIPSETFVLVILGMHFFYSMVTILGLC